MLLKDLVFENSVLLLLSLWLYCSQKAPNSRATYRAHKLNQCRDITRTFGSGRFSKGEKRSGWKKKGEDENED